MNGNLKQCNTHKLMNKIAKIILDVAAIGWIALMLIVLVMLLSSCGTTKNCCEKTAQEVYEYEGWVVD